MKRKVLFLTVSLSILLGLIFGSGSVSFAQDEGSVGAQNLALAQRFVQEVMIDGDTSNIRDFFGRTVLTHSPTSNQVGSFSAAQWGQIVTEPLGSDQVVELNHLAAAGDVVFVHLTYQGTFENPVGTPSQHIVQPTGEFLTIRRVLVMRFEDGIVVEQWDYYMNPLFAVDYVRYLPEE